jgi:DnaJ family protein C protein 19
MSSLLLPLVIIFGGWWLLRTLGNTQPANVRPLMRKVMGWGLVAAGGFLSIRGSINVGLPLVMLGGGMIGAEKWFPSGMAWPGGPQPSQSSPPSQRRTAMSRDEALSVLGLKAGATADEVRAAYKRLMKDFHPDRGGSDYLAAQINQAKDVLLQDSGPTT